jgi:hypothetical protein
VNENQPPKFDKLGRRIGVRTKLRSDFATIRGPIKPPGYWSKIQRGKMGKKATCHPDRAHCAKGFCKPCYWKNRRDTDSGYREREQLRQRIREQTPEAKKVRATYRKKIKDSNYYRDQRDAVLYNLLPGEREILRQFQGGRDPISGMPLVPGANLDHDHKTGKVRGLLNPITNKFLVDNERRLLAMLSYIRNPPAPLALGETVFGLIGQAKHKKKMLYGPNGTSTPHPRKKNEQEKEGKEFLETEASVR